MSLVNESGSSPLSSVPSSPPEPPRKKQKTHGKKEKDDIPKLGVRRERTDAYKDWPKQSNPITDIAEVPARWNWSPNDLDLDEHDIEGNIERCLERIATGIMPQIFRDRLKVYLRRQKAQKEIIKAAPRDVSFEVAQRLHTLRFIHEGLEKSDDQRQLRNVKAIIRAYCAREITWSTRNEVTYWYRGKMIAGPKTWDIDEAIQLSRAQKRQGFWIEGLNGPAPTFIGLAAYILPTWTSPLGGICSRIPHHFITLQFRIPGSTTHITVECLDDSGASHPMIYPYDMSLLEQIAVPSTAKHVHVGQVACAGISGVVSSPGAFLEVRVTSAAGEFTDWVRLLVLTHSGDGRNLTRLTGSWWRYMLYTLTTPDNKAELTIATQADEVMIDDVDASQAVAFGGSGVMP